MAQLACHVFTPAVCPGSTNSLPPHVQGVPVIEAPGEAEAQCAQLCKENLVSWLAWRAPSTVSVRHEQQFAATKWHCCLICSACLAQELSLLALPFFVLVCTCCHPLACAASYTQQPMRISLPIYHCPLSLPPGLRHLHGGHGQPHLWHAAPHPPPHGARGTEAGRHGV